MLPRLQQRLSVIGGRMPAWVRILVCAAAAGGMYVWLVHSHYRGHAWTLAFVAGLFGFGFIEVFQTMLKSPVLWLAAIGVVWLLIRVIG